MPHLASVAAVGRRSGPEADEAAAFPVARRVDFLHPCAAAGGPGHRARPPISLRAFPTETEENVSRARSQDLVEEWRPDFPACVSLFAAAGPRPARGGLPQVRGEVIKETRESDLRAAGRGGAAAAAGVRGRARRGRC